MLGAIAVFDAHLTGRWLLFATGLICVFGMFLCTAEFNLLLNNRLAKPCTNENMISETWTLYFRQWTRWNHLSSGCLLVVLVLSLYYLVKCT